MDAAAILVRATAHARALRGRVLVVKLGGSAMEEPAATAGTLESLVALQTLGLRIVLVHGGGKPIDRAMAAAGLTPRKVAGRRYTDAATLDIVVRVLRDEINPGIVKHIQHLGGRAAAITDSLTFPISGLRLILADENQSPVDLGAVGQPTAVDGAFLSDYTDGGIIPVIPSLCRGEHGGWLNVNADTIAAAVAGAFPAAAAIFLTDTPGVLRDRSDPQSLFTELTIDQAKALIASKVIDGGMIPKVEACFDALNAGAGRAVIADGRVPHGLLNELLGRPNGTTIVPETEQS